MAGKQETRAGGPEARSPRGSAGSICGSSNRYKQKTVGSDSTSHSDVLRSNRRKSEIVIRDGNGETTDPLDSNTGVDGQREKRNGC